MPTSENFIEKRDIRALYIKWWTITVLIVPVVLDFLFFGSQIARYSRVLILAAITTSFLVNHKIFLKNTLVGLDVSFLTASLYCVGTASALSRGGVITPNIALLIALMIIQSANIDLHEKFLKYFALSVHILVGLSVIAILLRMNPRNIYISDIGYPVFFDFIGIQGRNYGIFPHPNSLGLAAGLSLLLMVEARVKPIFFVLPLICLIKCGSRTSLFALFVGLLLLTFVRFANKRKMNLSKNKIQSPLAVGVLLLGFLLASSAQFMNYINFLDPGALTQRVAIWQTSLLLFKSSRTFGLGWDWESRAIDSQLLNVWAVSAHNGLLEIAFSAGIIGLVIFLAMLAKAIVYFPIYDKNEKISLIFIIISGISEAFIDLQYPTLTTYLFFMILTGASRRKAQKNG